MDEDAIFFGKVILVIIVVLFVLFYSIGILVNKIISYGELEAIERLRKDVNKVNFVQSEDVIGQVTMFNQKIMKNKKYNKLWWSRLTIPNCWDDVEIIEIPE